MNELDKTELLLKLAFNQQKIADILLENTEIIKKYVEGRSK